MHPGSNPFDPQSGGGDPFGPPSTPSAYGMPAGGYGSPPAGYGPSGGYGVAPGGPTYPPPTSGYNTYAVLSPIFAVVVPPAGVALGHLALPQIRRTGERGRGAAIAGLVIGYAMSVVLVAALLWWLTSDADGASSTAPTSTTRSSTRAPSTTRPPPASTVTSVAPPSEPPRIKLDLATVPIGTCVEIQRRSTEGADALDLFQADCEHRTGVYTVTARVGASSDCRTTYAAAPPDRSLAVCLDPY